MAAERRLINMDAMTGIILTDDKDTQLGILTEKRATAAMPMAGRYRLIDFILSCMVNSGIRNVGVATQFNYQSLMDHLGSGKDWDLSRKNSGLYILPPYIGRENTGKNDGDIDVLYGVRSFIRKTKPDYIVLSRGNTMYNMTFNKALEFHKENHADITVIYNEDSTIPPETLSRYTLLEVGENGVVTDIIKNHAHPNGHSISMDTYIIERSLLISLIENSVAHGEHDWVMDVLIKNLGKLRIFGYKFDGYVGRVDTIDSYYQNNMNFLNSGIRREMFLSDAKIYTKVKDQVPTHYGDNARVIDSMVADGCLIDGTVENSIIFRGVHIGKGSTIKNSIVMQNSVIQENCYLENVVLDKEVTLLTGKTVMGQPNYPFVIAKGNII